MGEPETTSPDPLAEVRQRAYQAIDQWLDSFLPLLSTPETPTLLELSEHLFKTRSQLLGTCLQAILDHILSHYTQLRQTSCPTCARRLYRKRLEPKKLTTLHGTVEIERPYFYCVACRQGFHPLDEALELAREVHQYDVQQKLAGLAAELPYGRAVEQFEQLTGVPVGEHVSHETLNRIAQEIRFEDVIPERAEIERRIEKARPANGELPVLVVAVDGAHSPIRPAGGRREKRGPGYWRETKGFRLYLSSAEGRILPLASWHQIETAEKLTQHLQLAAERVPLDRVTVALVGDGAPWVWHAMEGSFPEAHQVLDYYHCAEHVWTVANAQYDDDSLEAQSWAETTLVRLYMGWVSDVLGGLKRMKPINDSAAEEVSKLINYLEEHRHRVHYDEAREQGLPRGSGGIESANKFLVHARLKRSGAWWLEANGNGMLRLRCAIYNGTFDRLFRKYVSSKRKSASKNLKDP